MFYQIKILVQIEAFLISNFGVEKIFQKYLNHKTRAAE